MPAKSFYFGERDRKLFGRWHFPQDKLRPFGVILAYPFGQEYIRAHRTFTQLERRISDAGYHVLRFDYYGTGDSMGSGEMFGLSQAKEDLETVVYELKMRTGVSQFVMIGMRLGANLVMDLATDLPQISGVVAWEPILDGAAYLESLQIAHQHAMADYVNADAYAAARPPGFPDEVLGFPLSETLQAALRQLPPFEKALETFPGASLVLSESGASMGTDFVALTPSTRVWLKEAEKQKSLVPVQILKQISEWLTLRFK